MKKYSILMLVLLMLFVFALSASAASWTDKVTGGGQAVAGGIDFSITVSASEDSSGNATGQMEYSRVGQPAADLSVHGAVECVGLFDDSTVAVAAGPAREQNDPTGILGDGEWMVVEIKEGGVGYGDRVRVRLASEAIGLATCSNPSGIFPGLIYDGNFNLRSK